MGDVVYVGGSLSKHGGHNVLEPAAHAKPIIVGPNMQNFKDSYALLSKVGACKMVNNVQELTSEMLDIIADDKRRAKMGAASLQVIKENRGADVRSIKYLKELLELTAVPAKEYFSYPVNTRNLTDEGGGRLRHGDAIIFSRLLMVRKHRLWAGYYLPFCGYYLIFMNLVSAVNYLFIKWDCRSRKNCPVALSPSAILR